MIKHIGLAAIAFALSAGSVIACPGDKAAKDKTAGTEQNMSAPSEKFLQEQQKAGKGVSAGNVNTELKLPKPKV